MLETIPHKLYIQNGNIKIERSLSSNAKGSHGKYRNVETYSWARKG